MRKLTNDEFVKLTKEFVKQYNQGKHQRIGQAWFNALSKIDKEIAIEMTGRDSDCFYSDNKLTDFINELI